MKKPKTPRPDTAVAAFERWADKARRALAGKHTFEDSEGGDTPGARVSLPVLAKPEPLRTDFNHSHIPPLAYEREARRGLIRQWLQTRDRYAAAEMKKQEDRMKPVTEMLQARFGDCDGSSWVLAMVLEVRFGDPLAVADLGKYQKQAIRNGDTAAIERVAHFLRRILARKKPIEDARFVATAFVLRSEMEHKTFPPMECVMDFLRRKAPDAWDALQNNNLKRDLWKGPVLGRYGQTKRGRPRNSSTK